MAVNSIYSVIKSKGLAGFSHRMSTIRQHYGFTPAALDHSLQNYVKILERHSCPATFPITAVTLQRYSELIKKYRNGVIDFAVHGYTHCDYLHMDLRELESHLNNALRIFSQKGLSPQGFRSPYLRRNDYLYSALEKTGLSYISNQPYFWEVIDVHALPSAKKCAYDEIFIFYDPWLSSRRSSLPRMVNNLLEIPVSLPDDEILVERFGLSTNEITPVWQSILEQSYRRGELFTLQLHPERVPLCASSLEALLDEARALNPPVWCATLSEISAWWRTLGTTCLEILSSSGDEYQFTMKTPAGVVILARSIEGISPFLPYSNTYQAISNPSFIVRSPCRPVIGISPHASLQLVSFLRQMGYITEISENKERYSFYFDQIVFDDDQEKSILDTLENSTQPLVRLARWPNGAQSALAVTGDIDALTLWDFGLRLVGR